MDTPSQLSETLLEQSAQYQTLSDQLVTILEYKPDVWLKIRQGTQSDTAAERQWAATPEGIAETTLRLKLKALEKNMSAIKARLRIVEIEVRNMI